MGTKNILLLSKEILRKDYLSCYGSLYYKTPNIDKLAEKGTMFKNFYTAAPSSAMSYSSMFTGLNPFEMHGRKYYQAVSQFTQCKTLFNILVERGYETHIIWDKKWHRSSYRFSRVYDPKTIFHDLLIGERLGPHKIPYKHTAADKDAISLICVEVENVLKDNSKPKFIWIHCPHVLLGGTAYGSDISLFDQLTGRLMEIWGDDPFYLTGDHGHMKCEKNKITHLCPK